MERVASKQEGTGTESSHPLATDTAGKEPGGGVSGASPTAGFHNGEGLTAAGSKHWAQHQQHEPAESEEHEHEMRTFLSPRASSTSPKMKHRALPAIEHSLGQGDPAVHPAVIPAMLPPLHILPDEKRDKQEVSAKGAVKTDKQEERRDRQDTRAKGSHSLKVAATAVVSAGTIRNFRRSSAAMHVELLRVFVPDMLINVSAQCLCLVLFGAAAKVDHLARPHLKLWHLTLPCRRSFSAKHTTCSSVSLSARFPADTKDTVGLTTRTRCRSTPVACIPSQIFVRIPQTHSTWRTLPSH